MLGIGQFWKYALIRFFRAPCQRGYSKLPEPPQTNRNENYAHSSPVKTKAALLGL